MNKGLKLFIADIVDEASGDNYIWYVMGRTYDSAFKRFTKEANKTWRTYLYYFDEANEDRTNNFIEWLNGKDIKAGIYEE